LPRPKPQARQARIAEARAYLDKAREFLRAAQDSLELSNNTAAVGNAVHAGILTADAISAARTRKIWRGDHAQAAGHLETAGEDGKQAARHLRRLLPLKTRAEYDATPVRAADAKAAVQAVERLVSLAGQALASAPQGGTGEAN
jgi:HEPN domain